MYLYSKGGGGKAAKSEFIVLSLGVASSSSLRFDLSANMRVPHTALMRYL